MTANTNHIQPDTYKWPVLALAAFTFTFVVALPQMSLPVLFDEISAELGLSLVQVGWIWGMGSVMGIVVGLIGGPLGDRFGPRRTLAVACLLIGIAGAARGFSNGFVMLAITMLITGFALWLIPMNVHKTCGIWFSRAQLGMANGVVSVGMALGFLSGSLLAATVFSPLLDGWRNVLFVQIHPKILKSLKIFLSDYPEASAMLLYRGTEKLEIDGIPCWPIDDFLLQLKPNHWLQI